MPLADLSIPSISISLALPDDPPVEPFSPFDSQPPSPLRQEDSYRPSLLSPPVISPRFHRQPSPLRPADTLPAGKGLDRSHFEALLASTRERNASAKKEPDLRKELALKAHKSKQSRPLQIIVFFTSCPNFFSVERRALFLSKVNAPPSPTATGLPKTPPESPSIFHYSLPSPGLISPLSLFESLQQNDSTEPVQYPSVEPWVEQVEYRQLQGPNGRPPSLEQITAHLSFHRHAATAKDERHRPPIPLPTFLRSPSRTNPSRSISQPPMVGADEIHGHQKAVPRTTSSLSSAGEPLATVHKTFVPPACPSLQVTTTRITRPVAPPPTELTERNLTAFNSRTMTGRDMMSKLRRRTSGLASLDGVNGCDVDEDDRRARRISAPPDLPKRKRDIFAHPVLALPGAF
jgi:hypothetical protein